MTLNGVKLLRCAGHGTLLKGERSQRGEQIPREPADGNPIAKAKGGPGDRKSEGRRRQSPDVDEQKPDSRPAGSGKRTWKRLIPIVRRRVCG